MSKKFYFITIVITLAVAASIVALFMYFESKSKDQQEIIETETSDVENNNGHLPIEELAKKPNLNIQTEEGVITINNVYKNPVERLSMDGIAFAKNENYYMAFYPQDEGFLISINDHDVVPAAKKAEDDFIKQLNITKEQACKLKVSITVAFDVNEDYAGGNYGFSFCSGVNSIK